jgi:hypothetical protein
MEAVSGIEDLGDSHSVVFPHAYLPRPQICMG